MFSAAAAARLAACLLSPRARRTQHTSILLSSTCDLQPVLLAALRGVHSCISYLFSGCCWTGLWGGSWATANRGYPAATALAPAVPFSLHPPHPVPGVHSCRLPGIELEASRNTPHAGESDQKDLAVKRETVTPFWWALLILLKVRASPVALPLVELKYSYGSAPCIFSMETPHQHAAQVAPLWYPLQATGQSVRLHSLDACGWSSAALTRAAHAAIFPPAVPHAEELPQHGLSGSPHGRQGRVLDPHLQSVLENR